MLQREDKSQTICNGNDPANTNITPIVFEIGGGANTAVVTGLPSGMTFTYSPTTKRITISGTTSIISVLLTLHIL